MRLGTNAEWKTIPEADIIKELRIDQIGRGWKTQTDAWGEGNENGIMISGRGVS